VSYLEMPLVLSEVEGLADQGYGRQQIKCATDANPSFRDIAAASAIGNGPPSSRHLADSQQSSLSSEVEITMRPPSGGGSGGGSSKVDATTRRDTDHFSEADVYGPSVSFAVKPESRHVV
jgi:hypothetical protein